MRGEDFILRLLNVEEVEDNDHEDTGLDDL